MTKDERETRLHALTRLALATREKVDRETYVLYLDDTSGFSTGVLVDACRRLETSAAWFPKVAELMEECRTVARQHMERAEERARKRLPPPAPRPEVTEEFLAKIRALARKKAMR